MTKLDFASAFLIVAGFSLLACDEKPAPGGEAGGPIGPSADDTSALPKLGKVPSFELTNEDGTKTGSKELQGAPYLAAFMFTRCPSICPELTRTMKTVDQKVKEAKQALRLISISVDPQNDQPEVLLAYAKKHGADVDNWNFLTGDYATIAKTSEEGFKIGLSGSIDESKPHLGITHGSHLILVDGTGTIRSYFRSNDDDVADQIVAALPRL